MRQLTSPAREILDYLFRHPDACDTFEGIAHWWLLDQNLGTCLPRLDDAISELVHLGVLEPLTGPDGVVRYRANRTAIDAQRRSSLPPPIHR